MVLSQYFCIKFLGFCLRSVEIEHVSSIPTVQFQLDPSQPNLNLYLSISNRNCSKCFWCMQGIWSGMIGGTFIQTLILLWITFRTDWNKEVNHKSSFQYHIINLMGSYAIIHLFKFKRIWTCNCERPLIKLIWSNKNRAAKPLIRSSKSHK
jgi:hypothetical protein